MKFSTTLAFSCLLTLSGCIGDFMRPKKETLFVVVDAGEPLQILKQVNGKDQKVKAVGQSLKSGQIGEQDISGWVSMPPSHWERIKPILEAEKAKIEAAKPAVKPAP